MNTEVSNDNAIGQYLKSAREKMGLTQKEIAAFLCLKVSTIRDIETGHFTEKICATFLKGYIKSYARLVKIPEKKIMLMINKEKSFSNRLVPPIQSYSSINKFNKKYNKFIIVTTWIIIFLVIGLTIIWYWQYYKDLENKMSILIPKENSISVNSSSVNRTNYKTFIDIDYTKNNKKKYFLLYKIKK